MLRNVLVALNHIQIDNWQLDPPTHKYVHCAYILYNCVAINVNASNKKQQYNIKQSSTINKKIIVIITYRYNTWNHYNFYVVKMAGIFVNIVHSSYYCPKYRMDHRVNYSA